MPLGSVKQRIAIFSVGTPASPLLTLTQPLSADATDDTVYLSAALPISAEELAKVDNVAIVGT